MSAYTPIMATTRVLYREAARACRSIDRLTTHALATRQVNAMLIHWLDAGAASLLPQAAALIHANNGEVALGPLCRAAFRAADGSLDLGFKALRSLGGIQQWLQVNSALNQLLDTGASVEQGASVISDEVCRLLIDDPAEHPAERMLAPGPCLPFVEAQLDEIAARVRERAGILASPDASHLHRLTSISAVMYGELGFVGCFDDVVRGSSLRHVLQRRRGLPILLTTVYAGVASRLGIQLSHTNFPNRVLLRLEGEAGEPPCFVDAFAQGEILSPDMCESFLCSLGIPVEAHGRFTQPVEPRLVWSRMLRNLAHRTQAGDEAPVLTRESWAAMGLGLETDMSADPLAQQLEQQAEIAMERVDGLVATLSEDEYRGLVANRQKLSPQRDSGVQ